MAKKKRTKKYNPLKALEADQRLKNDNAYRQAKKLVEGLILTSAQNHEGGKCIVRSRDGEQALDPLPRHIFNAIADAPHDWRFYLGCMRKERNGKERLVISDGPYQGIVHHDAINDAVGEAIKEMLTDEAEKGNDITNTGWIAIPDGDPLDDEHLDYLFQDVMRLNVA